MFVWEAPPETGITINAWLAPPTIPGIDTAAMAVPIPLRTRQTASSRRRAMRTMWKGYFNPWNWSVNRSQSQAPTHIQRQWGLGVSEVSRPLVDADGTGRHEPTSASKKGRNPSCNSGFRPCLDVLGTVDGGGGGNRTPVRRYSRPSTTCLARCLFSDGGNTTCEAHRRPHPLCSRSRLTGRRRPRSCDDDPTSTSTGTSGFGARP